MLPVAVHRGRGRFSSSPYLGFRPIDISDVGPGSIRSELSLNFSEITNNNYQTVPVIRDRKGSGTSSVTSERQRASAEINRSSTGVLNRLAYNLIGDSRGRTPSGSTTGTT